MSEFDKTKGWKECYFEDTQGKNIKKPIMTKPKDRLKDDEESPVITSSLNRRILKDEFYSMDESLQKRYILFMRQTYGATNTMIGELLGVSETTFWRIANNLHIGSRPKYRCPKDKKAVFYKTFFEEGYALPIKTKKNKEVVNVVAEDIKNLPQDYNAIVGGKNFGVDFASATFRGYLDIKKIESFIGAIFDANDEIEITLNVKRLHPGDKIW